MKKEKKETRTNAGYLIFKEENYSKTFGICIGANQNGFVTWQFSEFENQERSYFWGHYFTSRDAAMCDYHQRLALEYETNFVKYTEEP